MAHEVIALVALVLCFATRVLKHCRSLHALCGIVRKSLVSQNVRASHKMCVCEQMAHEVIALVALVLCFATRVGHLNRLLRDIIKLLDSVRKQAGQVMMMMMIMMMIMIMIMMVMMMMMMWLMMMMVMMIMMMMIMVMMLMLMVMMLMLMLMITLVFSRC
jgi:hypothetical protein